MKNILVSNNCLLVHCFCNESKYGSVLERVIFTIENLSQEICCSTLSYQDNSPSSTYADIGLIIEPGDVGYSCPIDGGTKRFNDGTLFYNDEMGKINPSESEIEEAIKNKGVALNEFLVSNYKVKGVFARLDTYSARYSISKVGSLKQFLNDVMCFNLPFYIVEKGMFYRFENESDGFKRGEQLEFVSVYA